MDKCKKLDTNLILESVCELRFEPAEEKDIAFTIASSLKNKSTGAVLKTTEFINFPKEIKKADENFKYKPTFQVIDGGYILGVSENSITIDKLGLYTGFDEFSQKIKKVISDIDDCLKIKKINEIRLRYLNVFEDDLFSAVKLDVSSIGCNKDTLFTIRFDSKNEENNSGVVVTLNNKVKVVNKNKGETKSVIDLDGYNLIGTETESLNSELVFNVIDAIHQNVYDEFQGLLKESFVEKCGGWHE